MLLPFRFGVAGAMLAHATSGRTPSLRASSENTSPSRFLTLDWFGDQELLGGGKSYIRESTLKRTAIADSWDPLSQVGPKQLR